VVKDAKYLSGERVFIRKADAWKTVVKSRSVGGGDRQYVLRGDDGRLDEGWYEHELDRSEPPSQPNFDPISMDPTAFMSGQIHSKLWLCRELEQVAVEKFDRPVRIWLLAGWYGMVNFLLQTREKLPIEHCTSFDIDPGAEALATSYNEAFQWTESFQAITQDINTLSWDDRPDIVVNTSTEHIDSNEWFHRIPSGVMCAFQSNDMIHDDHSSLCGSEDDLVARFPLSETLYRGTLGFKYPDFSFRRFLHIGIK
jgi:hypothetical protein